MNARKRSPWQMRLERVVCTQGPLLAEQEFGGKLPLWKHRIAFALESDSEILLDRMW